MYVEGNSNLTRIIFINLKGEKGKIMNNKEKLEQIKERRMSEGGNYNNQLLIIIVEELMDIKQNLSSMGKNISSLNDKFVRNIR